jgi:16S rRNA (guanine(1405)-N(7))-methyltransferase
MNEQELQKLVEEIKSGARYRVIHSDLVRQLAIQEEAKGRSWKETVKAVRNKLHQVGGAYQEQTIPYTAWLKDLQALPHERHAQPVMDFCQKAMRMHASTQERLPILANIYQETLAPLGPIQSILDLACGLNPLSLAWMPLASDAFYSACDIYQDMLEFINHFMIHIGQSGQVELCDLTTQCPQKPVQVALLLKTIPCLEQVDKTIGSRLLDSIQAEHILVSFPARSLGGRNKGMVENYAAHFKTLLSGRDWKVQTFEFQTELVFRLDH